MTDSGIVHPGTPCRVEGATGRTAKGTAMVCSAKVEKGGKARLRWRSSEPPAPKTGRRRRGTPILPTVPADQQIVIPAEPEEPAPPAHATTVTSDQELKSAAVSCTCGQARMVPFARAAGEKVARRLAGIYGREHEQDPDSNPLADPHETVVVHMPDLPPDKSRQVSPVEEEIRTWFGDPTYGRTRRLSELRAALPNRSGQEIDRALRDMVEHDENVQLAADPRWWEMPQDERMSALRIGGEDRDLISIQPAAGDRSLDGDVEWSKYLFCLICNAGEGRPCWDMRTENVLNSRPHAGRPTRDTPSPMQQQVILDRLIRDGEDSVPMEELNNDTDAPPAGPEPEPAPPAERWRSLDPQEAYDRVIDTGIHRADTDDLFAAARVADPDDGLGDLLLREAAARSYPPDPTAVPVSGKHSDELVQPNYGEGARTGIGYHPHGAIGYAVSGMGDDQFIDVDGKPLATHLGEIASEVTRGEMTPRESLRRLAVLRDRMPHGSQARREINQALGKYGTPPDMPAPVLPPGTPQPLVDLAADLHRDFPIVQTSQRELRRIRRIAEKMAAGDPQYSPRRLADRVKYEVCNLRHESAGDAGKWQIDRRVMECVEQINEVLKKNPRAWRRET